MYFSCFHFFFFPHTHHFIHWLFPDFLPSHPFPWPLFMLWLLPLLGPSTCLTLVSVPSYSFSFTFPRPLVIFNSVIMTYSVGTWYLLSPTLHSHPWILCDQHSFPEPLGQNRSSTAARYQSAALTVSPASCPLQEVRVEQKMEATEKHPSLLADALGQCELGVTLDTTQNSFTL